MENLVESFERSVMGIKVAKDDYEIRDGFVIRVGTDYDFEAIRFNENRCQIGYLKFDIDTNDLTDGESIRKQIFAKIREKFPDIPKNTIRIGIYEYAENKIRSIMNREYIYSGQQPKYGYSQKYMSIYEEIENEFKSAM